MAAAGPLDDPAGAVRTSRERSRRMAFACVLLGAMLVAARPAAASPPSPARAAAGARAARAADAPGPARRDPAGRAGARVQRAPSLPPLTAGVSAGSDEESGSGSPQSESDPLVSNG